MKLRMLSFMPLKQVIVTLIVLMLTKMKMKWEQDSNRSLMMAQSHERIFG